MIRVSWIDSDTADEAARAIRRERIEPRIPDRTSSSVSVLGDKDSACSRRRPQSCRVRTGAREGGNVSTGTSRAAIVRSTCRQICCASGSDLHEITAVRVRARGRKLRAISFEECPVAGPILGPPDAQGALEDCSSADRIGNDGRVKLCAFAAGYDGTAGDDPFQRIAVPEVYIVEVPRE